MFVKKLIFYTVGIIIFSSVSAKADLNEYLLEKTKEAIANLSYSDAFLEALERCSPMHEDRQNMGIEVSHEIKGRNSSGDCLLENVSRMQGMEEKVTCRFDKQVIEEFIQAQKGIKKMLYEAKSVEEISGNVDYVKTGSILLNEKICVSQHSAYHQYQELRENLKKCTMYQKKIDLMGQGTMTLRVLGPKSGKCAFHMTVLLKALEEEAVRKVFGEEALRSVQGNLKSSQTKIECAFTEDHKQRFINLLAKTDISADEIASMEMLQEKQKAQKEAFDYLGSISDCRVIQEN